MNYEMKNICNERFRKNQRRTQAHKYRYRCRIVDFQRFPRRYSTSRPVSATCCLNLPGRRFSLSKTTSNALAQVRKTGRSGASSRDTRMPIYPISASASLVEINERRRTGQGPRSAGRMRRPRPNNLTKFQKVIIRLAQAQRGGGILR
jgi:hypothetical protein